MYNTENDFEIGLIIYRKLVLIGILFYSELRGKQMQPNVNQFQGKNPFEIRIQTKMMDKKMFIHHLKKENYSIQRYKKIKKLTSIMHLPSSHRFISSANITKTQKISMQCQLKLE
jgi:hypothetical protein